MPSHLITRKSAILRRLFLALTVILALSLLNVNDSTLQVQSKAAIPKSSQGNHTISQIKHIVFIMKENHSFDNYFGLFPGVNGATTGQVKVNGKDITIPLGPFQDVPPDYLHGWLDTRHDIDKGKMDQFNTVNCAKSPYPCYAAAQQADLPNYWALASNFLLNDNTFASTGGSSYSNRMFSVAAASGADIPHSVINGPLAAPDGRWGCDADPFVKVELYNHQLVYPCFSFSSFADEMTSAGVSWKEYAPQLIERGYAWNALTYFKQDINSVNDVPWQSFATDAQSNTLPAFSWLVPPGQYSEHPGVDGHFSSMCVGENWTTQQINAVEQSPAWSSTVIVVSWDEFGGFYDHAPPSNVDQLGYGIRVPLLVISPFAHADDNPSNPHVNHDLFEHSSVIRLAEEAFGLPSMNRRDVSAGDLLQTLDFSQTWDQPIILQQRTCPHVNVPPHQNDSPETD